MPRIFCRILLTPSGTDHFLVVFLRKPSLCKVCLDSIHFVNIRPRLIATSSHTHSPTESFVQLANGVVRSRHTRTRLRVVCSRPRIVRIVDRHLRPRHNRLYSVVHLIGPLPFTLSHSSSSQLVHVAFLSTRFVFIALVALVLSFVVLVNGVLRLHVLATESFVWVRSTHIVIIHTRRARLRHLATNSPRHSFSSFILVLPTLFAVSSVCLRRRIFLVCPSGPGHPTTIPLSQAPLSFPPRIRFQIHRVVHPLFVVPSSASESSRSRPRSHHCHAHH